MFRSAFALIGLLLTGCPLPLSCPEGTRAEEEGCVPSDAGTDVPLEDAGPCGMACVAPTPFCDEASGDCVACRNDGDCTAPTAACVMGSCEECDPSSNDDCTDITASRCDGATNECAGCGEDADCMHLTATSVCDESRMTCVACTTDTEATTCGANACIVATGTCGTRMRHTRGTCDSCEADSECTDGRRCIDHVFMGSSVGSYCFLDATGGCGDTNMALRPYRTRTDATSLGGVAATYCFPPTTTTCAGIRDTQSVTCTTDDMCGLPDVNDAYCPTTGAGAGACSYRCGGAFDCADPLGCGDTPQHCRPM